MGYLLCGPERWIVDRGTIYTERLFGAATKNTDKTLFLVLQFLKATTPFVVFSWSDLFCCVLVPGALAFHLLYTLTNCDCLVYSVSPSDHIIISCISLG